MASGKPRAIAANMSDPLSEMCVSCGAPPRQHCECLDEPPAHHFNRLSPEVAELLAILAEECGEVAQRVGKVLRHGLRVNPYEPDGATNAAKLEDELADIRAICGLLGRLGVIDLNRIGLLQAPKLEKLRRPDILHHSSLLKPRPCSNCGSTDRIQTGCGSEFIVICVDMVACNQDVRSQSVLNALAAHL